MEAVLELAVPAVTGACSIAVALLTSRSDRRMARWDKLGDQLDLAARMKDAAESRMESEAADTVRRDAYLRALHAVGYRVKDGIIEPRWYEARACVTAVVIQVAGSAIGFIAGVQIEPIHVAIASAVDCVCVFAGLRAARSLAHGPDGKAEPKPKHGRTDGVEQAEHAEAEEEPADVVHR